jgi:Fe-S-cluster-containing dehydrogenase component
MGISRRDFFKVSAAGGAMAAAALAPASATARETNARLPEAVGILYDATVCVGCKACMVACKEYNHLPAERSASTRLWDDPRDLSAKTYNIVKLYKNGTGRIKDQEQDGYSFIRRFCMHCVDPSCVSACPVGALYKDPQSGIVQYNKDNCIGCRYCQIACPYNIPKFEWDTAFPQIRKCQMCAHRIAAGEYPACCEFCPNGGSVFGDVRDLLKEAKRRLALKPGEIGAYPLHRVDVGEMRFRVVTPYQNHIFGEKDGGGTQVIMLAGVPFQRLGLPMLPESSQASHSETLMHTLYKGMIGPYAVLGVLFYLVFRHTTKKDLP